MVEIPSTVSGRDRLIRLTRQMGWWSWTILAGVGGLWLLYERGAGRLTNGWFAVGSAIAACPLTAPLLARKSGLKISTCVLKLGAIALFIIGKVALLAGL